MRRLLLSLFALVPLVVGMTPLYAHPALRAMKAAPLTPSLPPAVVPASTSIYLGQMTTTIVINNMYLQPIGKVTRTYDVEVLVAPPLHTSDGLAESNPFFLAIQRYPISRPAQLLDLAEISVWSALKFKSPPDPREYLVQYWQYSQSGDSFAGSLRNSHRTEGLTLNDVASIVELGPNNWSPCIGPMIDSHEGGYPAAQLQGTFTGDQVAVEVQGYATICGATITPFDSKITATRQATTRPATNVFLPLLGHQ